MMKLIKFIDGWIEGLKLKSNRAYRASDAWTKEAAEILYEFMDPESAVAYAAALRETYAGDTPQEAVETEMSYWDD